MASSRDEWASVGEYRTCVHHTAPIAANEMDCCDANIRNLNGECARHACERHTTSRPRTAGCARQPCVTGVCAAFGRMVSVGAARGAQRHRARGMTVLCRAATRDQRGGSTGIADVPFVQRMRRLRGNGRHAARSAEADSTQRAGISLPPRSGRRHGPVSAARRSRRGARRSASVHRPTRGTRRPTRCRSARRGGRAASGRALAFQARSR